MNKKSKMFVACMIAICTMVSMSFVLKPSTVEASEFEFEIEERPEENVSEIPESHGTISVLGQAFQECSPDRLMIYLKIIGKDPESAEKARDMAAKIIDEVLKALKWLGISEDDIGTTGYTIKPKYEWENKVNVFKGYVATVTMSIKLKEKDFDKSGKVIDASVNAGALVDSINFELSREKRDEIKLKLLAEAAKDGKLKAEIIVSALGDELGNVKTINVNDCNYQPHVYYKNSYDVLDRDYAEATPPTTIMPTDLTVSASINLVFEVF